MSVIVERGTVDDGVHLYKPGDVITGLSAEDEQELVSSGACRYAAEQEQDPPKPLDLPEGLAEVGKGLYELPNGVKVKGKAKAIEALDAYNQELDAANGNKDEDLDDEDLDDDGEGGPKTDLPIE